MPRLGGFAVEKKVPVGQQKCRFFVFHVVAKVPNSPQICGFPLVTNICSMFPVHVEANDASGKTAFPTEPGEAVGGKMFYRIQCTNQN